MTGQPHLVEINKYNIMENIFQFRFTFYGLATLIGSIINLLTSDVRIAKERLYYILGMIVLCVVVFGIEYYYFTKEPPGTKKKLE